MTLPDNTIRSLALMVGDLPEGDTPEAWFLSTQPQVVAGFDLYLEAQRIWNDRYAELLAECKLPPDTKYVSTGTSVLTGLVIPIPPPKKLPPMLRVDKNTGHLIPRKRTTAERKGNVLKLYEDLENIPQAATFLPGMPNTLIVDGIGWPIHVRKSAKAKTILVFLKEDPDFADKPFEVSEHWSRMKMSTFHLLRERQRAAKKVK